ncbi:MAG: dihydroorotase [Bacteroidales bacterium]|nr:dihydroorotase [Candidatus Cacconaster merdequi]
MLIKGGTLVLPEGLVQSDILIEEGVISSIARDIVPEEGVKVVDASGKTVSYGLADVHVHFREPGYAYKETIATGSAAAARGGYTCVCPMPNLSPAPDSPDNLGKELDIIRRDAVIDVRPYATITIGRLGKETVDFASMKALCAAFSDDGSGIQDEETMLKAMTVAARENVIIAAHCEDNSLLHGGYIHDGSYAAKHSHRGICSESEWGQIARDLRLAKESGCAYHVCHISTKESVELIRRAKAEGVDVTCETAPHYLVLTQDDLQEDGRFKMNPPLRDKEDRKALVEGLLDGTIDMIATDHAPHSAEEKSKGLEKSAMGITGLETAFPVLYTTLVKGGVISLEKLFELMCTAPRRRFRLGGGLAEGQSADIAVFDLSSSGRIDSSKFLSKGKSTPFDGMEVSGECIMTIFKGKTIYEKQTTCS